MIRERHLIEYCAPTLASLKTGNLFWIEYYSEEKLESSLTSLGELLTDKGVSVEVLRQKNDRVLVYVYRHKRLCQDLNKPGVAEFLQTCGYEEITVEYALERLKRRIARQGGFPHEIGLFLSYPLGDVIGFIENRGQNCKCVGCWKVYCDECEAQKTFARFDKCCQVYKRLFQQGLSLWQLTVAA
ncbi:MAG: DUF3793 family protein [Lachnospiraceae bacterium]|nr:DUF3793 family protein [Lachnospiraceae bacterium]